MFAKLKSNFAVRLAIIKLRLSFRVLTSRLINFMQSSTSLIAAFFAGDFHGFFINVHANHILRAELGRSDAQDSRAAADIQNFPVFD